MFKQPCLSVESQKEQMTYRVSIYIHEEMCAPRLFVFNNNFLTLDVLINFEWYIEFPLYSFTQVVLTFFNVHGLDVMESEGYELRPIRDTNLFFILKLKSNIKDDQCCSVKVCILKIAVCNVTWYVVIFMVIVNKLFNVDAKCIA